MPLFCLIRKPIQIKLDFLFRVPLVAVIFIYPGRNQQYLFQLHSMAVLVVAQRFHLEHLSVYSLYFGIHRNSLRTLWIRLDICMLFSSLLVHTNVYVWIQLTLWNSHFNYLQCIESQDFFYETFGPIGNHHLRLIQCMLRQVVSYYLWPMSPNEYHFRRSKCWHHRKIRRSLVWLCSTAGL